MAFEYDYPMKKSPAVRQASYYARRNAAGWSRMNVWVQDEHRELFFGVYDDFIMQCKALDAAAEKLIASEPSTENDD